MYKSAFLDFMQNEHRKAITFALSRNLYRGVTPDSYGLALCLIGGNIGVVEKATLDLFLDAGVFNGIGYSTIIFGRGVTEGSDVIKCGVEMDRRSGDLAGSDGGIGDAPMIEADRRKEDRR